MVDAPWTLLEICREHKHGQIIYRRNIIDLPGEPSEAKKKIEEITDWGGERRRDPVVMVVAFSGRNYMTVIRPEEEDDDPL